MLFDLGGRRKRFIQVIYVFLALLLGGSLVFFGIGGDAPGGLGDAIGISPNNPGSTGSEVLDADIEAANLALEQDPDDQEALLTLAKAHFLAGQTALTAGEEEAALSRYDASTRAFSRFLRASNDGKRIKDPEEAATTATLVLRAFGSIGLSQRGLEDGVRTAELVVEERPSTSSYIDLAVYAYAAGETRKGDEAADRALQEVDESNRSTIEQQLEEAKRQGRLIQRQLDAQAPSEEDLQNPLGGFGFGNQGSAPDGPG
jgi:tetratricopeptide (TPR) repeat protein